MRKFLLSFIGCCLLVCSAQAFGQAKESRRFASYIAQNGQNPMAYIADKIRTHYVVALGEDHWIKDHPAFLCDVISTMARDTTANIDILALEFGNRIDQKFADSVAFSPTYRKDLVIKILQNAPDDVGNPYKEYEEIFHTVWQCNLQKSKAHRTRIILLDPPYVLKSLDGESFSAEVSRDEAQMHTIRNYILQKKNVLFYAGLGHVWSQIWSIYLPSYDYCYNYQSAGNLLKTAYPDQVFLIQLWGALMGRNGYIPTNDNRVWQPLYGGVIDKAFEINGNSPVGFDVCEAPFDKVTVARFYTTPETYADYDKNGANGSTYTKTRLLSEQIDGIVFFKPIKEFSGATVSEEFFDDDFVTRIQKRTNEKCSTRQEIYEYMRKSHPIMGESLDHLIRAEQTDQE